jgi:hypothetical protein
MVDRATLAASEHFVLERLIVGPDRPAVLDPDRASVHVLTAIDGPVRLVPVASGSTRARLEPIVLAGLETAVVSAATSAYAIDAPAQASVLLAWVP